MKILSSFTDPQVFIILVFFWTHVQAFFHTINMDSGFG